VVGSLIVIYVRISSDVTFTGLGVQRQIEDCRALIARLGLAGQIDLIEDNDVSAFNLRKPRPGWLRLAGMIEQGDVGVLVAYNSDRLYRRLGDLESLVALFEQHPVEIRTVTSGDIDLSTADGRMHARILATVAQHESERKAERIARKHQELAETGKWKGGPRPFGYEPDGVTIREDEAAVARAAARRVIAGQSATQVARWASDVLGRRITQPSLVRSLTAPHIAAIRLHVPEAERAAWDARRARGEVVGEEPHHWLVTHTRPGTWPAVLDEQTWRDLRSIYRSGERRPRPRRSLLAGVLRCAECESSLGWGEGTSDTQSGVYATYRCVVSSGGCGRISIGADALDRWISDVIRGAADEHAETVQALAPQKESDPDVARRGLEARIDDLADAFGAGELTRDQHLRQRDRILAQLAALDTTLTTEARRKRRQAEAWSAVTRWETLDRPEKATTVRALIRTAWVFPSGRGYSFAPKHRVALLWIDDQRALSVQQLRTMLPAAPAPPTDAERKAKRNARARAKRQALKTHAK
jgi:site-specific DNA recombinase